MGQHATLGNAGLGRGMTDIDHPGIVIFSTWRTQPALLGLLALLLVMAAAIVFLFRDFGFALDTIHGLVRAQQTYDFLTSFGRSNSDVGQFSIVNFYGTMPDTIAYTLQQMWPSLGFFSRNLVGGAFGVGGVYFLYRLTARYLGSWTALVAAGFLALNPMWFGYMFINLKDIPFAVTLLAALFYSLECLAALPPRWTSWPKLALAAGALAATKLIGLPVLAFAVLVVAASYYWILRPGLLVAPGPMLLRRVGLGVTSVVAGSLACFALFWPQFYFYGPNELASVLMVFAHFDLWDGNVLLNGRWYPNDNAPWYFSINYIAVVMPLLVLMLTIIGGAIGFFRREPMVVALILISIVALATQSYPGVHVYNGYRHFLFLVPFLMLIAAYPVGLLLAQDRMWLRFASLVVMGISMATTVVEMARLHPYEYSFFNSLVGGADGASGRFDLDSWRIAYREVLERLDEQIDGNAPITIASCGDPANLVDFPRIEPTDWKTADYFILYSNPCRPPYPDSILSLPVIGQVKRGKAVMATIYARNPPGP